MKDHKISFSGPTYIAIRSAKHDSSTANSHQYDIQKLMELEEFKQSIKNKKGEIKPLFFVSVDGGPDESPSCQKTLLAWCNLFKKEDIDGIFVFTNAPGFSAFNKVERRMAPLSKDTAGIILPFNKYGSHLDASNRKIDPSFELENFEAAGKILASIWSETVIDSYPVVAEYKPPGSNLKFSDLDQQWIDIHVRQSRYLLQIVKCQNISCCKASRTSYIDVMGSRFLPPPVPLKVSLKGPSVHSQGQFGSLFTNLWLSSRSKTKVFDTFCPKMNQIKHISGKTELQRRVCRKCSIYYPTLKALNAHSTVCTTDISSLEDEDLELDQGDIDI